MSAIQQPDPERKLELRAVSKRFDGHVAVRESNLVLRRGEFLSLLGPSGCGKSTTLSMVAGFLDPSGGDILVDGVRVNGVAPQKRRIGLVFQDYAVFTRLSVAANLRFGLESQRVPRAERARRIKHVVDKLNLGELMNRPGGSLNMSEMQRVALARVLVTEPSLLLLDEPMSNLDAAIRESLRRELKTIQRDLEQTVLYVTHDQLEAMSMSDRIAIMNEGEILQVGTPEEIYHRPATRFVAEFIGDPPINLVRCTVEHEHGRAVARTACQALPLSGEDAPATGNWLLGVRPHHVVVRREPFTHSCTASVRLVENLGAEHVLHLDYGDELLRATAPPGFAAENDSVQVGFDMPRVHLVDADSGQIRQSADMEAR